MTKFLPLLLLVLVYSLHVVGALQCGSSGHVCGTNGRTYKTICHLRRARTEDPDLEVLYPGRCQRVDRSSPDSSYDPARERCIIGQPVCGTDGRTYGNICLLNYNRKHKRSLGLKHYGSCDGNELEQYVHDPPNDIILHLLASKCDCQRKILKNVAIIYAEVQGSSESHQNSDESSEMKPEFKINSDYPYKKESSRNYYIDSESTGHNQVSMSGKRVINDGYKSKIFHSQKSKNSGIIKLKTKLSNTNSIQINYN